jgi:putative DNA primase/helicase
VGQLNAWWEANPERNIGVFCKPSGFFVIDIDPRSGGNESWDKFLDEIDFVVPETVTAQTGEYNYQGKVVRGRHMYFKCDPSEDLIGNLKAANLPGIDIKHNGYVLVNPSRHSSGLEYEWIEGHAPWEMEMADATEDMLGIFRRRTRRVGASSSGGADWSAFEGLEHNGEPIDIDKLLDEGIDEGARAVTLYAMACALANRFPVDTPAGELAVESMMMLFNSEKVRPPLEVNGQGGLLSHVRRAIEFVKQNPKHLMGRGELKEWEENAALKMKEGAFRGVIQDTVSTSDPDDDDASYYPGTIGGVIRAGLSDGYSVADASSLTRIDVPKDVDAIRAEDGGMPGKRSLTDLGNGRRLVDDFGPGLRYTPGLGWFHWSGTSWQSDAENLQVREIAKKISSTIPSEIVGYKDEEKPAVLKWALNSKSNARINASIESATSDPRITVPVDSWDSDAELLGVANGVVNLRTGELIKGDPELYITRRSPIAYSPGAINARWVGYLDFATGGDKEYQDWLQRVVGYTMTGLNTLDIMCLVYGPPGSGKNTFVESIVKVLGTQQYAWPMDSNILADKDGMSSSTDLYHWAELRGKRMVWVDELPESERIKENAVKKLTGSSEISARSPGERPFTFQAQAKLWITTNHRPMITDDAMWRRIRPVPWKNVPKISDPTLKEFLFDPNGGQPAILAWAVEGAMKVLNSTAVDPVGWCKVVLEASEMYRKDEDRLGMFLNEETTMGTSVSIKSLFGAYRWWSEGRGEKPMTQIALTRRLRDRGEEITGEGTRAELVGRILKPTSTDSNESSWSEISRLAR